MTMKLSAIRVVALIATLAPWQALALSHTAGHIPANINSTDQHTCGQGELSVPR